ncbi:hypothetical protein OFN45_24325 [Escherichia coli]|nr:hypothetical protein [Escherichia coli]
MNKTKGCLIANFATVPVIYQFDIYEKSIYLSCEGLLFFLLNDINYHSYIKTIMAVKNIWQGCELNDQTF